MNNFTEEQQIAYDLVGETLDETQAKFDAYFAGDKTVLKTNLGASLKKMNEAFDNMFNELDK